jgi:hypothetical protein
MGGGGGSMVAHWGEMGMLANGWCCVSAMAEGYSKCRLILLKRPSEDDSTFS